MLVAQYELASESYSPFGEVGGESVSAILRQDGIKLAEKDWITHFPSSIARSVFYLQAHVDGKELLGELLNNPAFTKDDLAELSSSEIPELRLAAQQRLAEIQNIAK